MLYLSPMQNRVKQAFNKASHTYDDYSRLQQKVCQHLLTELTEQKLEANVIADWGCGTGISTHYLMRYFDNSRIYAIDLADRLVGQAKQKINDPRVQLLLADFDQMNFSLNSLDLIYASMSLQWSMNLKNTFLLIHQQLKNQGLVAFSLPLVNTFSEIKPAYRNLFYSKSQINELLEQTRFHVRLDKEKYFLEIFESPLSVLQSIKRTGASTLFGERRDGHLFCSSKLNDVFFKPNNRYLTYHIGFFVAEK
jgi:malonyl-CoA O-methyltransferase